MRETKNRLIAFRLTQKELERLDAAAKSARVNRSEALRRMLTLADHEKLKQVKGASDHV